MARILFDLQATEKTNDFMTRQIPSALSQYKDGLRIYGVTITKIRRPNDHFIFIIVVFIYIERRTQQ